MTFRQILGEYFSKLILIRILLCQNCISYTFIQHPELPQYFENLSKSEWQFDTGRRLLHFLKTEEKIIICQETLAAVIYRSHPSDQILSPPSSPYIGELLDEVEYLYEGELLKGIQLIEVTLQLPGRIVLVPAMPCTLKAHFSWFITLGFQTNEFFILEKEVKDENFHIHGISEPGATVDEVASFDQLQIEIHFLRNFRSAIHRVERRHFCNLENIQKLRLCASAHLAWSEVDDEREISQANAVNGNASACIENAVLWFENIIQENTGFAEPIKITLLSCAINSPQTEPQFYLAADQNHLNSAYILQRRHAENETIVYQLFLRISNISSLRKEANVMRALFEQDTASA